MSLKEKAKAFNRETQAALQVIWKATNKGQRNKLKKDPQVAAVLERYKVNTDE